VNESLLSLEFTIFSRQQRDLAIFSDHFEFLLTHHRFNANSRRTTLLIHLVGTPWKKSKPKELCVLTQSRFFSHPSIFRIWTLTLYFFCLPHALQEWKLKKAGYLPQMWIMHFSPVMCYLILAGSLRAVKIGAIRLWSECEITPHCRCPLSADTSRSAVSSVTILRQNFLESGPALTFLVPL
jgi:hypothetical protein